MNTVELDKQYVANTYGRFPIVIAEGKGSVVKDDCGKEYIDLGTGIAVNTFGVADDEWKAAVIKQLDKVQHMSNLYYTEPCAELAKMLCERTGMKKVFFGNSGAEANECAIKTARKYAADKYGDDRYTIVTLKNSFHGRTITTLAATGQDEFHKDFRPQTPGFVHIDAGNADAFEELAATGKIAAILMETVQGEGGVLPLDAEFVKKCAAICEKYDVLLMMDEVQTGNGRTGELYGYMNYGVTPDVVSTAKGLAGGLPLGACLMGEKVENTLTPGSHGSTFGGNPISCAAAISVLSRIDDALLSAVRKKSEYIVGTLSAAKGVKGVTGTGLMLGVETVRPAADVIAECREKGVLVIKAKNKVRLLPALNIPDELLKKAVEVIAEVCGEGI